MIFNGLDNAKRYKSILMNNIWYHENGGKGLILTGNTDTKVGPNWQCKNRSCWLWWTAIRVFDGCLLLFTHTICYKHISEIVIVNLLSLIGDRNHDSLRKVNTKTSFELNHTVWNNLRVRMPVGFWFWSNTEKCWNIAGFLAKTCTTVFLVIVSTQDGIILCTV
jgi:hypothetical protein